MEKIIDRFIKFMDDLSRALWEAIEEMIKEKLMDYYKIRRR